MGRWEAQKGRDAQRGDDDTQIEPNPGHGRNAGQYRPQPRARDISTVESRSNLETCIFWKKVGANKKTAAAAAVECAKVCLETEVRSEGYPQIVPGAVKEVDLIANLRA